MIWIFRKRTAKTLKEVEAAQLKVAQARERADMAHSDLERAVRRLLDRQEAAKGGQDGA